MCYASLLPYEQWFLQAGRFSRSVRPGETTARRVPHYKLVYIKSFHATAMLSSCPSLRNI